VICESTTGNVTVEGITGVTTSDGLTGGGTSGTVNVGVDPTKIQSRVAGACAGASAIKAVSQDGTVACQAAGTGTVTSVDSGFGLFGGPITGAGTLSVDPEVIQQRVSGTCGDNSAIRGIGQIGDVGCTHFVTRVSTAGGITGGPITNNGTIGADPTVLQRRVRGTCSGSEAIQSVEETGQVNCSDDLEPAGHVLVPPVMRVDPGNSTSLLFANGIRIVGACGDGPTADVKVLSTGQQVTAFSRSQSLGFVKATTSNSAKLGSSANGDRGDFNAFVTASSATLDGSFMSFVAGGTCVFEASGLAS
jgi:hypothetical protein